MARPLTRIQTAELANVLQALLDRAQKGDLIASNASLRRIEGAVKALQIVLGEAELSELEMTEEDHDSA